MNLAGDQERDVVRATQYVAGNSAADKNWVCFVCRESCKSRGMCGGDEERDAYNELDDEQGEARVGLPPTLSLANTANFGNTSRDPHQDTEIPVVNKKGIHTSVTMLLYNLRTVNQAHATTSLNEVYCP